MLKFLVSRKNSFRVGLVGVGMLLSLAGCNIYLSPTPQPTPQTQPPVPASTHQAPTADAKALAVQQIIELNRAGKISDEQMVSLLREVSADNAPAAQPEAPFAAPAQTAPEAVPRSSRPAAPQSLPDGYTPGTRVTGRLRSVGSDTMDNLMEFWGEAFKAHHPGLMIYHEGKGSSTAPSALAEGRCDFGPMSRAPKTAEAQAFKAKFGYEPAVFRVAVDAIAVYVHPSNPILKKGMDFNQLDAVFSAERKRGYKPVKTWGDLGLTGEWANAPIRVYSRNSASGTYGVFQKMVLDKGAYKSTNIELEGSGELVAAIANDTFGIGYSGIGYKTDDVALLSLSAKPGKETFPPEAQYAYTGDYPLARFLYLTINHKPGSVPKPLHKEFLSFVYSPAGQFLVTKDGFFPVSSKIAREDLSQLNVK